MKASFFRNVTNYETLYNNSTHCIGVVAEYHSIATICLEENEFAVFCEKFLSSYDYLMPFIDKAVIAHGVWTCVSVVYGDTTVLLRYIWIFLRNLKRTKSKKIIEIKSTG